jgi:glycosyltransferase involved in cell wall biosynthesis
MLVTFVIPCYDSAGYLGRCLDSVLSLADEDVEVILVDDGSDDGVTPRMVDEAAERHPGVVRAVHQPNGGHGAAVMRGIGLARGLYVKVVDSDDWLNEEAAADALAVLRRFSGEGSPGEGEEPLDLLVSDFVYEHVADGTERVMEFSEQLPQGRAFGWDEVGRFDPSRYMLMHALWYRTQLLRDIGLTLPRHAFYVDLIYAYVPLPSCKRLFYLHEAPYRYLVGRSGQSVDESFMVGRLADQVRVNIALIDAFPLEDVRPAPLRDYLVGYLAMDMVITTVFGYLAGEPEGTERKDAVWEHLREVDPWAYRQVRRTFQGRWVSMPGRLGRDMTVKGYELVRGIFKFN